MLEKIMHFGFPGCDTRKCSPETGSLHYAQCFLLFYLWTTFNTWLLPSVFKTDHEIFFWGIHKTALKSVEHYKDLLIYIIPGPHWNWPRLLCRLLVRHHSSTQKAFLLSIFKLVEDKPEVFLKFMVLAWCEKSNGLDGFSYPVRSIYDTWELKVEISY